MVTDGLVTKTLYAGSQYGENWMQSNGYWWDETTDSLVDFGLPDDWPTTDQLMGWYGYWIKTNKNVGLFAPLEALP
jgi:hypothetical protein